MKEPKRIITLIHQDGRITTEGGWYIGKLADLVDYDQLDRESADYKDRIMNLLPRGYAELFGRDDETDDEQRGPGRPPPVEPGPADTPR